MVNLKKVILSESGEPAMTSFKSPILEKGKIKENTVRREILLEDILRNSLIVGEDNEHESVFARYKLYSKIKDVTEVEFTEEEKTLLKELICPKWNIWFAGQAIELINQ